MSIFQTIALLIACVASGAFSGHCFAQYVNPATPEDYETMHDYLTPKAQIIETLPWSNTTTKEFSHPVGEDLVEHIRNHPMLGDELETLHEWLHQKVERLRPNGAQSFILVEATEQEFRNWSNRERLKQVGWRIVHVPVAVANRVRSVVALEKSHFSQAGFVTDDFLNRCNTQFRNRQFKPIKNARARFVKSIKMMTRANCSWCEKWKQTDYGQAVADGVTVELATDPNGTVPRFEVCDSEGRCRQYVGYKSYTEMKRDIQ
jgi:hypothetical protein